MNKRKKKRFQAIAEVRNLIKKHDSDYYQIAMNMILNKFPELVSGKDDDEKYYYCDGICRFAEKQLKIDE